MVHLTERKVAIYARTSTKDRGQNIKLQVDQLKGFVSATTGVRPGKGLLIYEDEGSSGKSLDRPSWKQMTADWRAGLIERVVVTRLDRAFRSVVDMHEVLNELQSRGVGFVSASQPIDTTTPAGKLLTSMLGAVAEFERELTVERVNEGLSRARELGHSGGRPRVRLTAKRAARYYRMNNYNLTDTLAELNKRGTKVSHMTLRRRLKTAGVYPRWWRVPKTPPAANLSDRSSNP